MVLRPWFRYGIWRHNSCTCTMYSYLCPRGQSQLDVCPIMRTTESQHMQDLRGCSTITSTQTRMHTIALCCEACQIACGVISYRCIFIVLLSGTNKLLWNDHKSNDVAISSHNGDSMLNTTLMLVKLILENLPSMEEHLKIFLKEI